MGVAWDTCGGKDRSHARGDISDKMGRVCHPHDATEQARCRGRENRAYQESSEKWLSQVHRVLQPGGVVKAFGGTRTFHRLGLAMEDVGFTGVHIESWSYATGFPKALDVGRALDEYAGVEREVVGLKRVTPKGVGSAENRGVVGAGSFGGKARYVPVTRPTSPDAVLWDGWGTALKPAWEPVLVGTKP